LHCAKTDRRDEQREPPIGEKGEKKVLGGATHSIGTLRTRVLAGMSNQEWGWGDRKRGALVGTWGEKFQTPNQLPKKCIFGRIIGTTVGGVVKIEGGGGEETSLLTLTITQESYTRVGLKIRKSLGARTEG